MGKLTTFIEQYRAGDIDIGELTEAIVSHKMKPTHTVDGRPDDPAKLEDWIDARVDTDEDTWNEVLFASYAGLLTPAEYEQIERAKLETLEGGGVKSVKPFWTGDKWRGYP